MKFPLLCTAICLMLCAPSTTRAQSRDGSIGDSWLNTPKEKPAATKADQPFLQPDKQYKAWDQRPQEPARTWTPKKQPAPLSGDLYSSNSRLIDSLTTLYCLSSNYLSTLRNRNEATRGTVPTPLPQPKDFSYQQSAPEQKPLPGRESPEALHKELMQLLEQCLYGRY
jgi:hypothetical protein